jgi:hypothetical protein
MRIQHKGTLLHFGENTIGETGIHGKELPCGLIQMLMTTYLWVQGKDGKGIYAHRTK